MGDCCTCSCNNRESQNNQILAIDHDMYVDALGVLECKESYDDY